MIQAIHSNQLYSETTIFFQGIVADEFTFVAVDTRRPDGSVEDQKRESSKCIRSCWKLCALRSIPAVRIYRTW